MSCPTDPGNYKVGPEDLLEVNIYGQKELNRVVRVDRDGKIKLPLVGEADVQGLSTMEVERKLESLYGQNYLHSPQVTVFVKEYRHQRVSVVGAVNKPGIFPMIGPRTIFEMLSEAGGLNEDAGDVVHVIRKSGGGFKGGQAAGSPQTLVINMRSALNQSPAELCSLSVQDGDVINVPYAGFAYVTGEVQKPGKVAVKQGLTVSQAVAVAGAFTPVASKQIQVLRFDEQGERQIIPVDWGTVSQGKGNDLLLKEDDVVVVPSSTGKKVWQGISNIFRGAFSVGYMAAP
ncbi:MAG: SLBB domain-containing protein [Deltaproteobacteria bacterium]|nr:SLBB domain-containing protein [Deltaproteobacteria bacterium]